MSQLLEILKKETESLKIQYVNLCKEWALNYFNELLNNNFFYKHSSGKFFKNRFGSNKAEDAKFNKIINILNSGLDIFILNTEKDALAQYENSVLKLAFRINEKNLNIENLKVLTSHIGVNIETTLTDGNKTVKAFTIIASGQIQKPHYRYLIK